MARINWNIDKVKQFVEVESQSGCKLLSEKYKNSTSKLLFLCVCGSEFETTFKEFKGRPDRNYFKRSCNDCGRLGTANARRLEYKKVKHFVESASKCKLLSKSYTNNSTELKFLCSCGNEFETTLNSFQISKHKCCPECRGMTDWNIDKVKQFVEENSNCRLLSTKYVNTKTTMSFKCECGNKFPMVWDTFLRRNKNKVCQECSGERRASAQRKTQSQFKKEVFECVGEDYSVIGRYINIDTKILIKHNECGHIWPSIPYNFLNGSRCPRCVSRTKSKSEASIQNFLESYNIFYISQKSFLNCKLKNQLYFDFFLPDFNIIIESDGEQHFKPVRFGGISEERAILEHNKTRLRDYIKTNYCRQHNIPLLRIPYWEFNNIEKILHSELSKYGLLDDNNIKTAI